MVRALVAQKVKAVSLAFAAEFDAIDPAIDWIKRHRTELVVGTVVVITGVAFAVVIAGSGGRHSFLRHSWSWRNAPRTCLPKASSRRHAGEDS